MCVGCMCVCTETHLIRACKYRSLMDQTFTMIRCNVIFNTLQHTATHCNMLQHAATCCNMLQHTATLLQYVVVLQCIRLLDSNRYNVARCNVMLCYTVLQCVAVCCSTLQCVRPLDSQCSRSVCVWQHLLLHRSFVVFRALSERRNSKNKAIKHIRSAFVSILSRRSCFIFLFSGKMEKHVVRSARAFERRWFCRSLLFTPTNDKLS
jgi:hypothetical protein